MELCQKKSEVDWCFMCMIPEIGEDEGVTIQLILDGSLEHIALVMIMSGDMRREEIGSLIPSFSRIFKTSTLESVQYSE